MLALAMVAAVQHRANHLPPQRGRAGASECVLIRQAIQDIPAHHDASVAAGAAACASDVPAMVLFVTDEDQKQR